MARIGDMIRPLSLRPKRLLAAATAAALLLVSGCSGEEENALLGERVTGSAVSSAAPDLPIGDSWDVLGAPNTDAGVRSYAFDRTEDESTEIVAVSALTEMGKKDGYSVGFSTTSGETCHSNSASSSAGSEPVLMMAGSSSRVGLDDACLKAKRLVVTVKREGDATGWLTLRIRRSSTPRANPEDYPEIEKPSKLPDLTHGASTEAKPGEWFPDAEDIEGRTLRASVPPGKQHTYSLPAQWGQGVQVRVDFDLPPSVKQAVEDGKVKAQVYLYDAVGWVLERDEIQLGGYSNQASMEIAPVTYRNMGNGSFPGPFTILVTAKGEKDVSVPYVVSAATNGDPNPAAGPTVTTSKAKKESGVLLWSLLGVGVVLIIAGMTQVTMHRQRNY